MYQTTTRARKMAQTRSERQESNLRRRVPQTRGLPLADAPLSFVLSEESLAATPKMSLREVPRVPDPSPPSRVPRLPDTRIEPVRSFAIHPPLLATAASDSAHEPRRLSRSLRRSPSDLPLADHLTDPLRRDLDRLAAPLAVALLADVDATARGLRRGSQPHERLDLGLLHRRTPWRHGALSIDPSRPE